MTLLAQLSLGTIVQVSAGLVAGRTKMVTDIPDLGPLPKGDRADELQQLSLSALRARLPVNRFQVRDEPIDKGVDGAIEVKARGRFTNIRSQFQIKAKEKAEPNADGSYSKSVDVSNFNYLLNGPSPVYIFWIESTGTLLYLWARDELLRIEAGNPDWKSQETVTLRFVRQLDDAGLDDLHGRTLREGQLHRHTHEMVARATTAEAITIRIDTRSLEVTDPAQVLRIVDTSGMSFVSGGYAKPLLELIDRLPGEMTKQPRVQLVVAYAQVSLGRYLTASGPIADALLRQSELSDIDRHFLASLRNSCDLQTGRINQAAYTTRENALEAGAPSALALQHRLGVLRIQHLATSDLPARRKIRGEIVETVRAIEQSDASLSMKLQARVVQLQAVGWDLSLEALEGVGQLHSRSVAGFPADPECIAELQHRLIADRTAWQASFNSVLAEAERQLHPILYGQALLARVIVGLMEVVDSIYIPLCFGQPPARIPEQVVFGLMDYAERARALFVAAGCLEEELRARLMLGELFDLQGQMEATKRNAEGVLGPAEAMGYPQIMMVAREHASGRTHYRELLAMLERMDKIDEDQLRAQGTDGDVRRFALHMLESIGLPSSRLPAVERDCFSHRAIAIERMDWCRHIELLVDKTHESSHETMYATDPPRTVVCLLHGYESNEPEPDWNRLLPDFKSRYCQGCPDRLPKSVVSRPEP